jgi:hypothetical protein
MCSTQCQLVPAGTEWITYWQRGAAFAAEKTTVLFEAPSSVLGILSHGLVNWVSLTSIELPASVRTIASSAFENCTSLAYLRIPERVEQIGTNAFQGCSVLSQVVFDGGALAIGAGAFRDCVQLDPAFPPGTSVAPLALFNMKCCPGADCAVSSICASPTDDPQPQTDSDADYYYWLVLAAAVVACVAWMSSRSAPPREHEDAVSLHSDYSTEERLSDDLYTDPPLYCTATGFYETPAGTACLDAVYECAVPTEQAEAREALVVYEYAVPGEQAGAPEGPDGYLDV